MKILLLALFLLVGKMGLAQTYYTPGIDTTPYTLSEDSSFHYLIASQRHSLDSSDYVQQDTTYTNVRLLAVEINSDDTDANYPEISMANVVLIKGKRVDTRNNFDFRESTYYILEDGSKIPSYLYIIDEIPY